MDHNFMEFSYLILLNLLQNFMVWKRSIELRSSAGDKNRKIYQTKAIIKTSLFALNWCFVKWASWARLLTIRQMAMKSAILVEFNSSIQYRREFPYEKLVHDAHPLLYVCLSMFNSIHIFSSSLHSTFTIYDNNINNNNSFGRSNKVVY